MRAAFQCRGCKGPPLPEKWEGLCPNCSRPYRPVPVRVADGEVDGAEVETLQEGKPISAQALMSADDEEIDKPRPTGLKGVDWVFDGGLPRMGTILFSGKEGSGKSTWLWQLLQWLGRKKLIRKSLFISSEQREKGLRRQFKRCGPVPGNMIVCCNDDKESIIQIIQKEEPEIVVADSISRFGNVQDDSGYDLASGAHRALIQIAKEIGELAEEMELLAFLVGHMNNDGTMAGGSGVRHEVDATLGFWRSDDRRDMKRILQFEGKSRFGDPTRRALYIMGADGLKDCGPVRDEDEELQEQPRSKPGLRLVNDDYDEGE